MTLGERGEPCFGACRGTTPATVDVSLNPFPEVVSLLSGIDSFLDPAFLDPIFLGVSVHPPPLDTPS